MDNTPNGRDAPQTADVYSRVDPSPQLLALATAQSGVVSASQTEMLGLSRHSRQRLLVSGQWRRLEGAVYVVHPLAVDWSGLAWAGVLLGGPASRLGGLAAAHLHGLAAEPPEQVDVLVPLTCRSRTLWPWTFIRERPGSRSVRSPGEPPRITVEDAVLDLCDGADVSAVVGWVTQAVGSRRSTAPRLALALAARKRFKGRRFVRELLGDVGTGTHSPLELRYLREVERPHSLPAGRRQHRSSARHLRDVVYDDFGLVVELDGRLGHEGMGRFRDMNRDNLSTLSGELTLRYGHADIVGSPCSVAAQVGAVLVGRGWGAGVQPCEDCSGVFRPYRAA